MRFFARIVLVFISISPVLSQDHGAAIEQIRTVEEAKAYADRYREVSVGIVNELVDKFLFEEIDTTDLSQNIGKSFDNFGRTTHLIKDTLLEYAEIEIIRFDLRKTTESTCDLLLAQMTKRIEAGESYWDVKKKFGHTSAWFFSGPELVSELNQLCGLQQIENSGEWMSFSTEDLKGLIRIKEKHDLVKAFYVIGYNSL